MNILACCFLLLLADPIVAPTATEAPAPMSSATARPLLENHYGLILGGDLHEDQAPKVVAEIDALDAGAAVKIRARVAVERWLTAQAFAKKSLMDSLNASADGARDSTIKVLNENSDRASLEAAEAEKEINAALTALLAANDEIVKAAKAPAPAPKKKTKK